jgi:hypothetical protein
VNRLSKTENTHSSPWTFQNTIYPFIFSSLFIPNFKALVSSVPSRFLSPSFEEGMSKEECVFDAFVSDPIQIDLQFAVYSLWLRGHTGLQDFCFPVFLAN